MPSDGSPPFGGHSTRSPLASGELDLNHLAHRDPDLWSSITDAERRAYTLGRADVVRVFTMLVGAVAEHSFAIRPPVAEDQREPSTSAWFDRERARD